MPGVIASNEQRWPDAVKFNQQCAAIASNFQAPARKNLAAIRGQYRIQ